MVPGKNGPRKKWSLGKMVPRKNGPWGKWSLGKNGRWEKWSPVNWSPGKIVPGKNGPREKWSPEKCPSRIVLRQKNARKFERLYFYRLIPLHTHKDYCRPPHDPTCTKL